MHEDISIQTPGSASPAPAAQTAGDIATSLAHDRTDMATQRNYMAAERTLMAWIRTALSLIGFGFTIGKLGQALGTIEMRRLIGGTRTVNIQNLAYFLVLLGTVALLAAAVQHWYQVRELAAMGLRRRFSIAFVVSLLLTALGGYALTSLVTAM
jgi:putative membrane protein